MGRKWRQRPIACQSCRRRKIRCSREFPCSNCTSRGIKCIQFYEPQESRELDTVATAVAENQRGLSSTSKPQRLLSEPSLSLGGIEPVSVLFPSANIQARLDRLESWITGLNVQQDAASSSTREKAGRPRSLQYDQQFSSIDTFIRQLSAPQISTLRQMTADAEWIGGNMIFSKPHIILTSTSATESFFDASISFHLSPIKLIKKPYCVLQDASAGQILAGERQTCIFLPLYHEACTILNSFTSDWTVLSPTTHVSTLFMCIQTVYTNIQEQKPVSLDQLLLFLGMIASVTHSSSVGDDMSRLFESHVEANSHCSTWISAAFAMADEVKRRGLNSLICLQAQTILMKVSCYTEGSSVRNRSLVSTSMAMARELGIHRIDLPGEKRLNFNSPFEVEMARRVWWDNVSIDWFLAIFPGPHEGVYTIHPQQMAVNMPSSIPNMECDQQPIAGGRTEETDLSHFLQRIRLAEIGRELVDSCPLSVVNSHERNQEKLREFDLKLEELQRNLPAYLALRKPGDLLLEPDSPQYTALFFQSLHINCLIYINRCIVHLRYLSFASVDERFSFSYQVCFKCAQEIVSIFRVIKTDRPWFMPRMRSTSCLRALLLASAIFLLDICSGVEIQDLQRQRPEMIEAWQILGDLEEDSNLIDQFLDFTSRMLKKYHVPDFIISALAAASCSSIDTPLQQPPYPVSNQDQATTSPMDDGTGMSQNVPMDATQRWQTLDTDFDIKTMSWDNVLWGFDSVLM